MQKMAHQHATPEQSPTLAPKYPPTPENGLSLLDALYSSTNASNSAPEHRTSETQFWKCSVCTFTENPADYPICKMCSALPPEQRLPATSFPPNSRDLDPLGPDKSSSVTNLPVPAIMDETVYSKSCKDLENATKSSESNEVSRSGISGFLGKVLSRNKKQKALLQHKTPSTSYTESIQNESISVASMPKKQQQKIAKRLGGLHTKKELLKELDSSMNKIQKKLKLHANKHVALEAEMARTEEVKQDEMKQWMAWYVLELVDLASELYSTEKVLLRSQLEVCFNSKNLCSWSKFMYFTSFFLEISWSQCILSVSSRN